MDEQKIPDLSEFEEAPAELPPVVLDRTPLEAYAKCPFQGYCTEHAFARDPSPAADSGTEVHDVYAGAILDHCNGEPAMDYIDAEMAKCRTDVAADASDVLRRGAWEFCRFLGQGGRNPADILRFQGGPRAVLDADGNETQPSRNGQVAHELLPATDTRGPIHVTTEFDLLVAGPSEFEVTDVDTKSGNKVWTSGDIKASFQFRFHAWIGFHNYPALEFFHVQIFMPRLWPKWSPRVTWTRKEALAFEGVLLQTVENRRRVIDLAERARDTLGMAPDVRSPRAWYDLIQTMTDQARREGFDFAWPGETKCTQCAATSLCPCVLTPAWILNDDPVTFAQHTMAMDIDVKNRKDQQVAWVLEHGNILDLDAGFEWGVPPAKTTKPKSNQYRSFTPSGYVPPESTDADQGEQNEQA